ncbi:hypothetical protein [Nocardia jiangsuensis]|uniref:IrrE N-terminal-like domain-containing protein n=1 Tax=Nocardia jiangsuensis TaxID=1691563 RepID=A0ABV8E0J3_9NOCA
MKHVLQFGSPEIHPRNKRKSRALNLTRRARRRAMTAVQHHTARLQPFSLSEFGRILSEHSGIPVRIGASTTLPRSIAGQWLRTEAEDVIEYAADLPEIARINTVLHEAGHILHGHEGDGHLLETGLALCSILSPTAIANFAHVRYRSAYDSSSERQAETFARRTLRTILWSDADTTESAEIISALGLRHTRLCATLDLLRRRKEQG